MNKEPKTTELGVTEEIGNIACAKLAPPNLITDTLSPKNEKWYSEQLAASEISRRAQLKRRNMIGDRGPRAY
jgi:hypothetical protein